jgi:hypothetical protein
MLRLLIQKENIAMSDKPKKFDPTKITFVEYKILKAQLESAEHFDVHAINGYEIDNKLDIGFHVEGNLAKVDLEVNIKTDSGGENEKEATSTFHLMFIYQIENLVELIRKTSDDKIEITDVLGNALSSVTYSTTRGILMTRLQSTVFQNCILPIIDPNELLRK